jgi:hypothetical protein
MMLVKLDLAGGMTLEVADDKVARAYPGRTTIEAATNGVLVTYRDSRGRTTSWDLYPWPQVLCLSRYNDYKRRKHPPA